MAKSKTSTEKVLAVLSRRKTPITAAEVANKTGLANSTVQTALRSLNGEIWTDVRYTGAVGRPPKTYRLA